MKKQAANGHWRDSAFLAGKNKLSYPMFDQRGVEHFPVWEDSKYYYTFDSTALPTKDQPGGEIEMYRKGGRFHRHFSVLWPNGNKKGDPKQERYLTK